MLKSCLTRSINKEMTCKQVMAALQAQISILQGHWQEAMIEVFLDVDEARRHILMFYQQLKHSHSDTCIFMKMLYLKDMQR